MAYSDKVMGISSLRIGSDSPTSAVNHAKADTYDTYVEGGGQAIPDSEPAWRASDVPLDGGKKAGITNPQAMHRLLNDIVAGRLSREEQKTVFVKLYNLAGSGEAYTRALMYLALNSKKDPFIRYYAAKFLLMSSDRDVKEFAINVLVDMLKNNLEMAGYDAAVALLDTFDVDIARLVFSLYICTVVSPADGAVPSSDTEIISFVRDVVLKTRYADLVFIGGFITLILSNTKEDYEGVVDKLLHIASNHYLPARFRCDILEKLLAPSVLKNDKVFKTAAKQLFYIVEKEGSLHALRILVEMVPTEFSLPLVKKLIESDNVDVAVTAAYFVFRIDDSNTRAKEILVKNLGMIKDTSMRLEICCRLADSIAENTRGVVVNQLYQIAMDKMEIPSNRIRAILLLVNKFEVEDTELQKIYYEFFPPSEEQDGSEEDRKKYYYDYDRWRGEWPV